MDGQYVWKTENNDHLTLHDCGSGIVDQYKYLVDKPRHEKKTCFLNTQNKKDKA